ncbi:dockerin type I repeat-containing protein [Ruminococcus sp.]|uniref:dockerin type I repeat-containing protein n=1 Tax=Ruminococcus sp. TaxID=41978 RepID=UPI0025F9F725|nr:dockerin type I repeat-containing protein [Ruminococcus sp.]
MKLKRICGLLTAFAICTAACVPTIADDRTPVFNAYAADAWYFAGETCDPLHDTSRDVQKEGVGNPLNFGERNTPADASAAEIRAINHKMTVQEVKYALYKEIDEHWDLISTRLGQPDREKMYALFLGLGSRESTLGEGKIGSDHETAYEDGWGVNSAHAYGTLQTAVTAFKDCDPKFMPEDNVPEMYQYSFTEQNFYDCIISNHMGIRKILHFAEICINQEKMHGYQVIRNSLKGFNTGWCTMATDSGAYETYADEICSMAQFYYNEGHLYDNVFTWTSAQGQMDKYRTADRWDWWGDTEPSMAPIVEKQEPATTTSTTTTINTTTTTTTTVPTPSAQNKYVMKVVDKETGEPVDDASFMIAWNMTYNTGEKRANITTFNTESENPVTLTPSNLVNVTDYDLEIRSMSHHIYYTYNADDVVVEKDAANHTINYTIKLTKRAEPQISTGSCIVYVVDKATGKLINNGDFTAALTVVFDDDHESDTIYEIKTSKYNPFVFVPAIPKSSKSYSFGKFRSADGKYSFTEEDIDCAVDTETMINTYTIKVSPYQAVYGDANCDGTVDMSDIVLIMQSLANPNKYGEKGTSADHITTAGLKNADVDLSSQGLTSNDALRIQEYLLHKITSLDPK